ncbi:DUF2529 family protein [Planococcus sp. ANT_H30]|uniref:DUF2529 family protein n=1 Tax=Planococcus sp. ANT_H30 TaxID=2597347 RepID=UPI0011EED401|nr:DUF2529 family protein [Planococcus sp. ANT_H30]KAA0958849.1 DUF2529 family protein [Planococcus sp. ANT_H30]
MNRLTVQFTQMLAHLSQQHTPIHNIASVLAQAIVAEGTVFIAAFGEMKAVIPVALNGLPTAVEWSPSSIVHRTDRVWILALNDEGDELAGRLADAGIAFAFVAAHSQESELADAFFSLNDLAGNLLQDDDQPALVPYALAALYIYYAVKLSIDDMLGE